MVKRKRLDEISETKRKNQKKESSVIESEKDINGYLSALEIEKNLEKEWKEFIVKEFPKNERYWRCLLRKSKSF